MKFNSLEEFTQALINNSNYYFEDASGDLYYFEDGDLWFRFSYESEGIPLNVSLAKACIGYEFNMVEK